MPARGSALGRAHAPVLRSCPLLVLDTFFYHKDNCGEGVLMKWRCGMANRSVPCAVSLAFILCNQIVASCSTGFSITPRVRPIRTRAAPVVSPTPPFSPLERDALGDLLN